MNRHESETLEAPERTGELAYKAKLAAHVRSRHLEANAMSASTAATAKTVKRGRAWTFEVSREKKV